MQKFVINKLIIQHKKKSEPILLYRFDCARSHADFSLTFVNTISRILLEFLILFTFDQSNYNKDFDELGFIIFQNFEDVLGSYSYIAICKNLKLTQVIKKFQYFKKVMLNERFNIKRQLFIETKSIIYFVFYDKTDTIYNNSLRALLQKFLFLIYKL